MMSSDRTPFIGMMFDEKDFIYFFRRKIDNYFSKEFS